MRTLTVYGLAVGTEFHSPGLEPEGVHEEVVSGLDVPIDKQRDCTSARVHDDDPFCRRIILARAPLTERLFAVECMGERRGCLRRVPYSTCDEAVTVRSSRRCSLNG